MARHRSVRVYHGLTRSSSRATGCDASTGTRWLVPSTRYTRSGGRVTASARSFTAAYTDGDVAMYRPYSGRAQPSPPAPMPAPDSSPGSRCAAARLALCATTPLPLRPLPRSENSRNIFTIPTIFQLSLVPLRFCIVNQILSIPLILFIPVNPSPRSSRNASIKASALSGDGKPRLRISSFPSMMRFPRLL